MGRSRSEAEAAEAAKLVHKQHYWSSRGIFASGDALVVYFNRTHPLKLENTELELSIFRDFLDATGVRAVGVGTYPSDGPEAGRTTVILLESRGTALERLRAAQHFAAGPTRNPRPGAPLH